jgi:hypothetical protein
MTVKRKRVWDVAGPAPDRLLCDRQPENSRFFPHLFLHNRRPISPVMSTAFRQLRAASLSTVCSIVATRAGSGDAVDNDRNVVWFAVPQALVCSLNEASVNLQAAGLPT